MENSAKLLSVGAPSSQARSRTAEGWSRLMGLALLPHWLINDDLRSGTLVNVFPDYEVTATDFSTAAWLVYPSRAYVPLKVRVFIDFLKQSISS